MKTTSIRRAAAVVAVAAFALTAAACGSGTARETDTSASGSATAGEATEETSDAAAGESDDGGTFATIEGTFGEVVVPAEPERIVALNFQVADILVSLGVQPIVLANSQEELDATYPWLNGELTGELDATLLENYQVNLEQIATHEPDLIVGIGYNFTEASYAQATDIAPTFAGVSAGNNDWDVTLVALATLTGTDAQAVLDAVEASCTAAQEAVPSFVGKTYNWVATGDGQYRFGNGSAFECFGLTAAESQENSQVDNAAVSEEQIEMLTGDLLSIWDYVGVRESVESDPRFATLPANTGGAVLWADLALASAINSPGPHAFDYLIEQVQPVLEAAAG